MSYREFKAQVQQIDESLPEYSQRFTKLNGDFSSLGVTYEQRNAMVDEGNRMLADYLVTQCRVNNDYDRPMSQLMDNDAQSLLEQIQTSYTDARQAREQFMTTEEAHQGELQELTQETDRLTRMVNTLNDLMPQPPSISRIVTSQKSLTQQRSEYEEATADYARLQRSFGRFHAQFAFYSGNELKELITPPSIEDMTLRDFVNSFNSNRPILPDLNGGEAAPNNGEGNMIGAGLDMERADRNIVTENGENGLGAAGEEGRGETTDEEGAGGEESRGEVIGE